MIHRTQKRFRKLHAAYQAMQEGGPALYIDTRVRIHNGLVTLAEFQSRSSAVRQLVVAGFKETKDDWLAAREESQ